MSERHDLGTDPLEITIVGAGMAGMMAALFLTRAGHRVTVSERDDNTLPDNQAAHATEHEREPDTPAGPPRNELLASMEEAR